MRFHAAWFLALTVLGVAGCGGGSNSGTSKTLITPTITWATPSPIVYGTVLSSTQLDASSGGVAGTFAYSPAAGTVLQAGSQTLSVTFTPADTTDYNSASGSVQLTVDQASPVITWATPAPVSVGTTLSSGQLNAMANVAGSFVYSPVSGTVENTAGTIPLSTTFTPTDTTDYTSATGGVTLVVNKATPAVSWATPSPIVYGTALSSTQLDASSGGVAGTLVYLPPTGKVLTAGSQTLSVTFTPTDTTDYTSANGSVQLTVNKATPVITWATPASVAVGTTLSSTQLDATASVPGSFVYAPVSGTVENTAGTVSLSTTFTPTDATDYAAATGKVSLTVTPAVTGVTVDFGTQEQLIRGFGGATVWLGQMPSAVATALFSPTSGLNLSILRVRIDPEGSASGGGAHNQPYETSQWDEELANGKEAVAANPNAIVFASPWTPPASMKTSSTSQPYNSCAEGSGYCGGYLNPTSYAAYASYLEDFVSFFNTNAGFDLYAISMQNEPDANVTYESCFWTAQQMDTWVANNASTITSDKYSTKFIMPESEDFNPAQAATALTDMSAVGQISIVAGHIYQFPTYGPIVAYSWPTGVNPKELWMTEFGPLSGAQLTFAQALSPYAISIHNSLVTGQYNAYVWWGAFGYATGSCSTSAGTCGLVDNSGNVTVMGEMMGQYSKFVLPGYYRYDATANPSANVYVSAYAGTDSGTQHYVIVAINAGSSAVDQPFTIQNATVTSMTPYQSTSSGGLAPQSAITVTGGAFTYALPAQSITTFVQ
jgi:O-glycosyl hydrolase